MAAWRVAFFVRLAQRYARYLLAVEQPAAGTVEILVAIGDVDHNVDDDRRRLGKAVGVDRCGQGNKGSKYKCKIGNFHQPIHFPAASATAAILESVSSNLFSFSNFEGWVFVLAAS